MSTPATLPPPLASDTDDLADVLVIGGGPAGAWAALGAAASGARSVVLVDKGYCGTSGATAPANTGAWYVTPEGAARERAIEARFARSGGLAHREWMARVLEATWTQINQLAAWGYPFPVDDSGLQYRANLRGPDYMYFLRRQLRRAGVRILDHSPALELLVSDGVVAGAQGYSRQQDAPWRVRAGAVVLASGGCAFLSKALGCDVNTGDGYLMATEVGAELSGMEFSAQYGISPAYASVTKGLPYFWATFTTESGEEIDCRGNRMLAVARALRRGPVYAVLDRAGPEIQRWLRDGQPNCFLPHDRLGIDPFAQRFPVTLRSEGTVRGSGGIRILDEECATSVPGLYAAGDAASRELIVGASSGGGSPNAAWAISSGTWAGRAAARFRAGLGDSAAARTVRAAGTVGLRPGGTAGGLGAREVIDLVQQEVLPLDKNLFRRGDQLEASVERLEGAWRDASAHLHAAGVAQVRAREAAALLATARFCYRSALARAESRGLHQRTDLPDTDPAQAHCLTTGGLSSIWVAPRRLPDQRPSSAPPPAPHQGDLA
ncbi:FAD-dependent oxidoreductase [Sorangium sp. So ce1099]|uniref:FAD-dependent oxidoreductase n=1 Tax=Sorangium sp. So ce1099 TaxID=3133331 RepID=UPI003F62C59C